MADFRTGDTLVWIIGPVLDDNGAAVTGASWSAVIAQKPDGTSFAPTYTEIGDGVYQATVVSTARGNWYLYSQATINGVTYADAGSITVDDAVSATTVTISSPVAADQTITLYQGDDYMAQDSRALSFALTGVPSLSGATATLAIIARSVSLSITCAIANAGQTTQTVTAELTAAQTTSLPASGHYDLSAALSNGDLITLARGKVVIVPAMSA